MPAAAAITTLMVPTSDTLEKRRHSVACYIHSFFSLSPACGNGVLMSRAKEQLETE